MRAPLLRAAAAAAACAAAGGLRLPDVLADHMVLQRAPMAARVWGWGTPGETVAATVTPGGARAAATAGGADAPEGAGYWSIDLPPQAAGVGRTVSLAGSQSGTAALADVAFGDVFLCSGQSNMQVIVPDVFNATAELADAARYAGIRVYTQCLAAADAPQYDGASAAPYQWAAASAASLTGAEWQYFSATCYFFGRELYKGLGGGVPVGLVASDWGGMPIEYFSSPDALGDASCGGVGAGTGLDPTTPGGAPAPLPAAAAARVAEGGANYTASMSGSCPGGAPGNSKIWYGQLYPLLPMRLTGVVWYQGESNAGDPAGYACRFPAMIADWRAKWGLPALAFLFVELAAFTGADYSLIRAAQMKALRLRRVGYATAIDLGDPTSPVGGPAGIHPRRKQEVGRRLALAALRIQYGRDVVAAGPYVTQVERPGPARVRLTFADAAGLHAAGTAACAACCAESPVELLVGGAWCRAALTVDAAAGEVTAACAGAAGDAAGARYAWEAYPQCALYNGAGGPDDHAGIAAPPFTWSAPATTKSYRLVFRQTYDRAHLWRKGAWSVNASAPHSAQFSALGQLERLRDAAGGFEFLMRWPDAAETQVWKQASNPVTGAPGGGVAGYEAISVPKTANGWAGLERSDTACALLDGSDAAGLWFYAVGDAGCNWGSDGMPAADRAAQVTELYALDPRTSLWALVFRQTWPHKWAPADLAVNKDDEGAAVFSRLDELESFRGGDGKLTFKMLWPDNGNTWRQTSNPVTASGGGVAGYAPIEVRHAEQRFAGLELNVGPDSLLDGSIGSPTWYYAVGMVTDWGSIPSWGPTDALMTEVFVRTK